MRHRGPWKADGGGVRSRSSDEKAARREGEREADLRRQLAATAEQRGGDCDSDRGAAAKAAVRLGFMRKKAAAAVLVGPRAWGGSFIGRLQDLGVRARDAVRGERPCRAVAGLGLEPESSSRWGMTPTGGWSRPSARGRRGEGSWRAGGPLGRGGSAGPAAVLGCTVEGIRERKASWAGPCGEEREKRKAGWAWAAWKKRERKKRKREWAGPKKKMREKKKCIQIHLNLNFKF
jgi:hypothetical protein